MNDRSSSPAPVGGANALDIFIRIVLLGGLLAWCALLLAPFTSILIRAVIIAVAVQPFSAWLARKLGGRLALAATLIVLAGVALVAVPGYFIGESLVSTVQEVRAHIAADDLHVPQLPPDWHSGMGLKKLIADRWPANDGAFADMLRDHMTEVRDVAVYVLRALGGFSIDALMFIASIVVAGFLLANARKGGEAVERFLGRAMGEHGTAIVGLAAGTIRNVAKGILGVALIQAAMLALGLFIAGVPAAGLLTVVGLMLAIVQIGVGPVAIGVIVYAWAAMGTLPATLLTAWMVITQLSDNILKPILLGRGASVPTVVVFLGAIGGFLLSGIIGLFTGAVVLSIGYRLMQGWIGVAEAPSSGEAG